VLAAYGFDHCGFTVLGQDRLLKSPPVPFCTWPAPWIERYTQLGLAAIDPLAHQALNQSDPVLFKASAVDPSRLSQPILAFMQEIEFRDCVSVPIQLPEGIVGRVVFTGRNINLTTEQMLEVQLLAFCLVGQIQTLRETAFNLCENPILTPREVEVLQWVAQGKTSENIAVLLDVTKRTVNQHVENAGTKLGTTNRTQTVIEAYRRGELPI
jgi:LuxR family transcriptional regulator, quorum-sensing system regulator BjaR1